MVFSRPFPTFLVQKGRDFVILLTIVVIFVLLFALNSSIYHLLLVPSCPVEKEIPCQKTLNHIADFEIPQGYSQPIHNVIHILIIHRKLVLKQLQWKPWLQAIAKSHFLNDIINYQLSSTKANGLDQIIAHIVVQIMLMIIRGAISYALDGGSL